MYIYIYTYSYTMHTFSSYTLYPYQQRLGTPWACGMKLKEWRPSSTAISAAARLVPGCPVGSGPKDWVLLTIDLFETFSWDNHRNI